MTNAAEVLAGDDPLRAQIDDLLAEYNGQAELALRAVLEALEAVRAREARTVSHGYVRRRLMNGLGREG